VSVRKIKTKGKISYRITCNKADGSDTESDGGNLLNNDAYRGRRPAPSPLLELLRKRSQVG
jgi:hypothetical protein